MDERIKTVSRWNCDFRNRKQSRSEISLTWLRLKKSLRWSWSWFPNMNNFHIEKLQGAAGVLSLWLFSPQFHHILSVKSLITGSGSVAASTIMDQDWLLNLNGSKPSPPPNIWLLSEGGALSWRWVSDTKVRGHRTHSAGADNAESTHWWWWWWWCLNEQLHHHTNFILLMFSRCLNSLISDLLLFVLKGPFRLSFILAESVVILISLFSFHFYKVRLQRDDQSVSVWEDSCFSSVITETNAPCESLCVSDWTTCSWYLESNDERLMEDWSTQ